MSGSTAKAKRNELAQTDISVDLPRLSQDEIRDFKTAWDAQQLLHPGWNEKEKLLINQTADSISIRFNSKVTDGRLSTIVIERAARVMAQLGTGVVRALTKKNRGLGELMTLFLTKYIQPNDNAQFPHLTKLRMVDMYSQVYGVIPVLYDLAVTETYLGPTSSILPIRSWYPQAQKLSVDDSDHEHVETMVSAGWLRKQKGKGSWSSAVIDHVLDELKNNEEGSTPASNGAQQQTVRQQQTEINADGGIGDAAQIRLVTRYENGSEGRWKTFLPEFTNLIARDAKSKDGHIPIVLKHHIPLIDSIYGLGAFERGKTLQYAMDSLVSMYMAGVQMSIFPPRIIQKGQVVKSSLDYAPGATWIETVKESIRNYQVSPEGLQTFQSTYGWLTGSLLNQNGATDTSQTIASTSDPTSGKTPQALRMQAQRESAADAWDTAMMEQFQQTLYERMVNLAQLTPKPFTFHIFDAEIQQLEAAGMDDVTDVFDSEKEALVTLPKDKLADIELKFIFDAGSNAVKDDMIEHAALNDIITTLGENPQLNYYLNNAGKRLNYAKLIERWVQTGGISYGDEIVEDIPQPEPAGLTPEIQAKLAKLPPQARAKVLAQMQGAGAKGGAPAPGGAAAPTPGAGGSNPMFYPSKKMVESIDVNALPLWAQVQLYPMAGIQIPPAVQQMAAAQAAKPPMPVDPNAPTPSAPDPSKDPNHQVILALLDRLDPASLRSVIRSVGLPANSMLPVEAEMIRDLSQPSKTDEQPIAGDIQTIEVDPSSPYGAAKDPHAHLAGSTDPAVANLYAHIQKVGAAGVPMQATDPAQLAAGTPAAAGSPAPAPGATQ